MYPLKKIVWLASYPKSGNTWFRVFLTNLLSDSDKPADINNLYPTTIASSRSMFDEATGISSSDLKQDEIDLLRPKVYRYMAENSNEVIYHKIHDAWIILPNGEPLVPVEVTKAVLYFIRNPLDVAISFAHHSATTIDKAIDMMNNANYSFCSHEDRLHNQTRQQLLTWSGHLESWIDKSGLPVMTVRYEDMHLFTFKTFKNALKFIGFSTKDEKISKALSFSTFDTLREQEQEKGFKEKTAKAKSFFRKGEAGGWRMVLTKNQVKKIIKSHFKMMEKYGYLPINN